MNCSRRGGRSGNIVPGQARLPGDMPSSISLNYAQGTMSSPFSDGVHGNPPQHAWLGSRFQMASVPSQVKGYCRYLISELSINVTDIPAGQVFILVGYKQWPFALDWHTVAVPLHGECCMILDTEGSDCVYFHRSRLNSKPLTSLRLYQYPISSLSFPIIIDII